MFFLGISANILIYLLASAFLGVLLYTHEKSVPAEYVSSAVVVVETRQEEPVHYEWYAYCEQIVPKAEKEHTIVYVEIQSLSKSFLNTEGFACSACPYGLIIPERISIR